MEYGTSEDSEWYKIDPGWSGESLGLICNQFGIIQVLQKSLIPQTNSWSGTFFAISYSKPALDLDILPKDWDFIPKIDFFWLYGRYLHDRLFLTHSVQILAQPWYHELKPCLRAHVHILIFIHVFPRYFFAVFYNYFLKTLWKDMHKVWIVYLQKVVYSFVHVILRRTYIKHQ